MKTPACLPSVTARLNSSRFARVGALVLTLMSLALSARADWGAWSTVKNHPGLEFRVRREEEPNQYAGGKYHWTVEFRSRYRETIHFSFQLTEPDAVDTRLNHRVSVRSGQTERSWSLLRSAGRIGVWTGKYRFGDSDMGPYDE